MTEDAYRLISEKTIDAINGQCVIMRRAVNLIEEEHRWYATNVIDHIEGMVNRDTFVCNVAPDPIEPIEED